ncbi:CD83 antigen isoform X2 [Pleurodeles waltl]|uniref:CD83 antigen isoform X2 n=1 Tax=Pleurodeles waltl TaxID=8319 RepID=UPI003709BB74
MAKKTRGSWLLNGFMMSNVWWGLIQAVIEVVVQCGEDAVLPCGTQRHPFHKYTQITWYKVSKNMENMNVIIRKNLQTGAIFTEEDQQLMHVLNDTHWSLRLKNTTSKDSGIYCCYLRAPLGEINQKTTIELKVTDLHQNTEYIFKESKTWIKPHPSSIHSTRNEELPISKQITAKHKPNLSWDSL